MFKFLVRLFIVLIVIGVIIGGIFYEVRSINGKHSAKTPEVLGASQVVPALQALLVQSDEKNGQKRVLSCTEKGCSVISAPSSSDENALSDGSSWYRYSDSKDKSGDAITTLEKVGKDGTVEKISEQNALVKPRGLTMSQDGAKVAYFLDNVHDNQGLTELWVYDNAQGGAKVVAENLVQKQIASRVRWNASSRIAWFLQDGTTRQFIAVPVQDKAAPSARFANVDWNTYSQNADTGVMDVNDKANLVAFTEPTFFGFSQLTIAQDSGGITKHSIKGNVVFVRWMENDALLYAVQDGQNLAFWIANSAGERPVARMLGQFRSAHSSGSSDLAAFVADPHPGESHVYVLQISTGFVRDETIIPNFSGNTYVVQANEAQAEQDKAVAGISGQLRDEELLAFVNDHLKEMTGDVQARAERMLTTDSKNTIYIDYTSGNTTERRVLVVIQDAVHPQWTVLARYTPIAGQWKRDQEAQNADPTPKKLYEYETSVSEWILKETY